MKSTDESKFMNLSDVMELTGLSESFLFHMVETGVFPEEEEQVSSWTPVWNKDSVQAWAKKNALLLQVPVVLGDLQTTKESLTAMLESLNLPDESKVFLDNLNHTFDHIIEFGHKWVEKQCGDLTCDYF